MEIWNINKNAIGEQCSAAHVSVELWMNMLILHGCYIPNGHNLKGVPYYKNSSSSFETMILFGVCVFGCVRMIHKEMYTMYIFIADFYGRENRSH